jgi:anti-sigma factor RsiW
MSHLDEGTLHALLDGELDLAEVSEIQKHLGTCVACGSRLQEVKQVLAEADRLVGAMEVPAGAPHRPEPPSRAAQPSPSPFQPSHEPSAWDEPPVLLVPDPIDAGAKRRRWIRGLALAATLGGVILGGKLIGTAFQPSHPVLPERDLTSVSRAPSAPPVVSKEETRKPPSALATRENKQSRAQPRTPAAAPRAARVQQEAIPDTQTLAADTDDSAAADSALVDSLALAAEAASDSVNQTQLAAGAVADSSPSVGGQAGAEPSASEADAETRRAAAAALAELDRERRRQRANAATAALPPPARPEPVEPEPAPRPPTLEQRSQVYLRIGLDEAVRQLGGPVHVIEGMTPELIGLTRTQLIPGSGSSRPVVRVVYLDARGRLILLDQQRVASGAAPSSPGGSLRWSIGDVMLYLRGEPSPEVLRSLQARVR